VLSVPERLGVFGPGFMQNYGRLLIIAGVFGFGGAFVSLLLSKTICSRATRFAERRSDAAGKSVSVAC
jgi:Zn-dependent protease with chaperone function